MKIFKILFFIFISIGYGKSNLFNNLVEGIYSLPTSVTENLSYYRGLTYNITHFGNFISEEISEIRKESSSKIKSFLEDIINRFMSSSKEMKGKYFELFHHEVDKVEDLDYNLLIKGIFQAVSYGPFETNNCYLKKIEPKKELLRDFYEIFNSFRDWKNILESSIKLFNHFREINDESNYCNFSYLLSEITSVPGVIGSAKITYRVFSNKNSLFDNLANFRLNYIKGNSQELGNNIGMIIRLLFNYTTQ
jgi:hypothetical protein